jgi:hypothetical protein
MGDQCVHGGVITLGCPTVLIGEAGSGGGGAAGGGGGGGSSSSSAAKSGGLAAMPVEALKNVIRDASPEISKKLSQVVTLKESAKSGVPFCEKCMQAAFKI